MNGCDIGRRRSITDYSASKRRPRCIYPTGNLEDGISPTITGIRSDAFTVDLSGVSDLRLSGKCRALTARVSGVGDLDAGELHGKAVKVRVSGIGDASVHATEAADAAVSGKSGKRGR